jgi:hypothetical protein
VVPEEAGVRQVRSFTRTELLDEFRVAVRSPQCVSEPVQLFSRSETVPELPD